MEWLANLSVVNVLIFSAVLFAIRLMLPKIDTPWAKSATETVESLLVAVVLVFLIIRPFLVQAFFIPSESMTHTLEVRDHILVNKLVYRFREPRHGDIIVFKAPPAASDEEIASGVGRGILNVPDNEFLKKFNLVIGHVSSPDPKTGEFVIDPAHYPMGEIMKLHHVMLYKDVVGGFAIGIDKITCKDGRCVAISKDIKDAPTREDLTGFEIRTAETDFIKRVIGVPGDVIEVKNGSLYRNGELQHESYVNLEDPLSGGEPVSGILYTMKPVKVPKGTVFPMGDNRNNSLDGHAWGPLDRNRILGKAMLKFWPIDRVGLLH